MTATATRAEAGHGRQRRTDSERRADDRRPLPDRGPPRRRRHVDRPPRVRRAAGARRRGQAAGRAPGRRPARSSSRFRREALAAARLVHPNIVQVFDFGLDERQRPALHRHGVRRAASRAPRSCATAGTSTSREARRRSSRRPAAGLDYAHRNGVVHRDVKPGNLLRLRRRRRQARRLRHRQGAPTQSSITQVGSVLGTAAYLAPEQARGEEAGPRADLYALGVVAYQLLSGRLPYEAQSLTELALKQQREAPERLDVFNPRGPARARAGRLDGAVDRRRRPSPGRDGVRRGAPERCEGPRAVRHRADRPPGDRGRPPRSSRIALRRRPLRGWRRHRQPLRAPASLRPAAASSRNEPPRAQRPAMPRRPRRRPPDATAVVAAPFAGS